jgi:CRP-like cAMP-binding protein
MNTDLEMLKKHIFLVAAIDDDAWAALSGGWTEVVYKRKQIVTRAGDTEKYLYFVLEGVQRAFYEDEQREATLVFSYAPSFSGLIDSFFLQTPALFTLETLTSSRLLRIHHGDLQSMMADFRSIERWVRIALTQVLAGTLQRQVELMSFTAEEKFTTLLKRSPQVLNLIPYKYLASYIGVDPATFSKLLGSVRL